MKKKRSESRVPDKLDMWIRRAEPLDLRGRVTVDVEDYVRLMPPRRRLVLVTGLVRDGDISLGAGKSMLKQDGRSAIKEMLEDI